MRWNAEVEEVPRFSSTAALLAVWLVASACTAASSDADESAVAIDSQPDASTEPAPEPLPDNFNADPLLRYADENHETLYDYESTFDVVSVSERTACSNAAAVDSLGLERLSEVGVSVAAPDLDLSRLSRAERSELAEALADCPGTIAMVSHLARSREPIVGDCIMAKINDLDSSPRLIAELGNGASFAETSTLTGFRYSCQQTYVDDLFGEHPGGTLGEDRRLAAEELVRDLMPAHRFDGFEMSCTARSVMASLPDQQLMDFSNQPNDSSRLGATEFFVNLSDEATFDSVIAGMRDGAIECVRPITTVAEVHGLELTDEQLLCLGDSELREIWFPFVFGVPDGAPPLDELIQIGLDLCGKSE